MGTACIADCPVWDDARDMPDWLVCSSVTRLEGWCCCLRMRVSPEMSPPALVAGKNVLFTHELEAVKVGSHQEPLHQPHSMSAHADCSHTGMPCLTRAGPLLGAVSAITLATASMHA